MSRTVTYVMVMTWTSLVGDNLGGIGTTQANGCQPVKTDACKQAVLVYTGSILPCRNLYHQLSIKSPWWALLLLSYPKKQNLRGRHGCWSSIWEVIPGSRSEGMGRMNLGRKKASTRVLLSPLPLWATQAQPCWDLLKKKRKHIRSDPLDNGGWTFSHWPRSPLDAHHGDPP